MGGAVVQIERKAPGVFMEFLKYRQRFFDLDRSSVDNIEIYLNREEEDSAVKVKGIITRYTVLRSTGEKEKGSIETNLEISSTAVSSN